MAKELSTKFSVDLGEVVSNSISAVKVIRRSEQARKEAEFQRAISNGLSFDAQIEMREKQLTEERASSISDADYIMALEKSVNDTKKLNRFNKYRTRYAQSLSELSSGKMNEESYLSVLKNELTGVTDPDLRLEILGDIATAEGKVKQYKDSILSNQVKKAKFDGTQAVLREAIESVHIARAQAMIGDNQDEVTAYDETLSALGSQLSSTRIQDSITGFQVTSLTRGLSAVDKLNYINNELNSSDPNTPIKIGDTAYTSAQQFWNLERDSYLTGSSKVFGDFFKEIKTETDNSIDSNVVKFGYPPKAVIDTVASTFSDIRNRPEVAPFTNRLDITQATVLGNAADKYAEALVVRAQGTSQPSYFKEADMEMKDISKKYGVDLTARRVQLQTLSADIADKDLIKASDIPELDLGIPDSVVKPPVPSTPSSTPVVTPEAPVLKTPEPVVPEVTKPVPEKSVSKEPIAPVSPVPVDGTPQYTPSSGVGTTSPDGKFTFTKEGWKPSSGAPVVSTPPASFSSSVPPPVKQTIAPTVSSTKTIPTTEAPKKTTYTGSSVTDYLSSVGQDSSMKSRSEIAASKGIANYTGSSEQNIELLKKLRGF